MPQLTLKVANQYRSTEVRLPAADAYGRRVRNIDNLVARPVPPAAPPSVIGPLFFKALTWLTVVAGLAVSLALWRLFHFAR